MTRWNFLKSEIASEAVALRALLESVEARRAGLTLTVEMVNGDGASVHQTLTVKPWTGRSGDLMLSVTVAGSGDWATGVKATKIVNVNTQSGIVYPERFGAGAAGLLQYAAYAAVRFAWTGEAPKPTNGTVNVTMAQRCVRCQSPLTDPESQRRMLGPECFGKATGSRTATSVVKRREPAAV